MDAPNTPLGRRELLVATGTGLAAAALPACTVAEFHYTPAGGDGGTPYEGQDSGTSPARDSSTGPGQDSAANPPQDSAVAAQDTGSPMIEDSSAPPIDSSSPPVDTGSSSTCTSNSNTLVVALSQYPQLGTTGGSVSLTDSRYSDPQCQQNAFYVVATGPGQFAAFSASCTHSCCTINLNGATASCPCHGAEFDVATGAVTRGPARTNLPALPGVCTDGTSIYIQLA